MTQHPITPPPELVQQLCDKAILHAVDGAKRGEIEVWLIQEAFRAGADQELQACCEWVKSKQTYWAHDELRAARRPTPLSAVAQAEALIECHEDGWCPSPAQWHVIRDGLAEGRRALEALPK
jgi:hypothetical protein